MLPSPGAFLCLSTRDGLSFSTPFLSKDSYPIFWCVLLFLAYEELLSFGPCNYMVVWKTYTPEIDKFGFNFFCH